MMKKFLVVLAVLLVGCGLAEPVESNVTITSRYWVWAIEFTHVEDGETVVSCNGIEKGTELPAKAPRLNCNGLPGDTKETRLVYAVETVNLEDGTRVDYRISHGQWADLAPYTNWTITTVGTRLVSYGG